MNADPQHTPRPRGSWTQSLGVNNVDKRYQVFVSSTFKDLQDERMEVMKALLDMDCVPVGMEYFPASPDAAWEHIQPLIDQSDYYVVIIGGKYGSLSSGDISYTRREYEYAVSKGVPTLAFAHENPGSLARDKTETDPERSRLLETFRALCSQRLLRTWVTKDDLAGTMSRSLMKAFKTHPRVGWVRADSVAEGASDLVVKLTKERDTLQARVDELMASRHTLPDLALMSPITVRWKRKRYGQQSEAVIGLHDAFAWTASTLFGQPISEDWFCKCLGLAIEQRNGGATGGSYSDSEFDFDDAPLQSFLVAFLDLELVQHVRPTFVDVGDNRRKVMLTRLGERLMLSYNTAGDKPDVG